MIPLQEMKAKLSQYISDVEKGSEFIVTKNGKPVAKLTPYIEQNTNSVEDILRLRDHAFKTQVEVSMETIKELIEKGQI